MAFFSIHKSIFSYLLRVGKKDYENQIQGNKAVVFIIVTHQSFDVLFINC